MRMFGGTTGDKLCRMDVRYMCVSCGTKWVVRPGSCDRLPARDCAACGGALERVGRGPDVAGWTPEGPHDEIPADAPS